MERIDYFYITKKDRHRVLFLHLFVYVCFSSFPIPYFPLQVEAISLYSKIRSSLQTCSLFGSISWLQIKLRSPLISEISQRKEMNMCIQLGLKLSNLTMQGMPEGVFLLMVFENRVEL